MRDRQTKQPTIQASSGETVTTMVTRVRFGAGEIVLNSTVPKLHILTTRFHHTPRTS